MRKRSLIGLEAILLFFVMLSTSFLSSCTQSTESSQVSLEREAVSDLASQWDWEIKVSELENKLSLMSDSADLEFLQLWMQKLYWEHRLGRLNKREHELTQLSKVLDQGEEDFASLEKGIYLLQGELAFRAKNYPLAEQLYLQSFQKDLAEGDSLFHIHSLKGLFNVSYKNRQADLAQEYASSGIALAEQFHKDPQLWMHFCNDYGRFLFSRRTYAEAGLFFVKALDLASIHSLPTDKYRINSASNLAYIKQRQGKPSESQALYNQVMDWYRSHPQLSSNYKKGDLFFRLGGLALAQENEKQAKEYYQQALHIYQSFPNEFAHYPIFKASTLHNLALVELNLGKHSSALETINQAIQTYRELGTPSPGTLVNYYKNQGRIYLAMEKLEQAIESLENAEKIVYQSLSDLDPHLIRIYLTLGEIYEKQNRKEKAKEYYQRATDTKFQLAIPVDHALALRKLAGLAKHDQDFQGALAFLQEALQTIIGDTISSDPFQNPPLPSYIPTPNRTLEILQDKAQALWDMGKFQSSSRALKASQETFLLASATIDTLLIRTSTDTDKIALQSSASDLYRSGFQFSWEQYVQSKDQAFMELAFYFAEKSKANLLLQGINTKQQGGDSQQAAFDSLENHLRIKLNKAQQDIFEANRTQNPDYLSKIPGWQEQVIKTRESLDSLKTDLQAQYPGYYRLKYDLAVQSIQQVQDSLLVSDQTLIEYFLTEHLIFAFVIHPDTAHLIAMPRKEQLKESIQALREGIFSYYTEEISKRTPELKQAMEAQYLQEGYELYYQLIGRIKEEVALSKKLVIIPDGVLGYVPFDALLHQPPSETASLPYAEYPYLMNDHQLSYSYSATLLRNMQDKIVSPRRKRVLGIGLSFAESGLKGFMRALSTRGGTILFPEIPSAEEEITGLQTIVPTTALLNEEAKEEVVKDLAPDFQVLHFSTHGYVDDVNSDYSFLAHHGAVGSPTLGRLYVRELYTMRLQSEMVFLSACETGIGDLYEGEGIISVARGFSYAGAKSILTTLWSISDQHSKWLVHRFYQYLDKGYAKDEALRLARLDYLKAEDFLSSEAQHPFFWAAFTPIGDMSSIQMERSYTWVWMVLGIGLVLIIGWRRRKNQQAKRSSL